MASVCVRATAGGVERGEQPDETPAAAHDRRDLEQRPDPQHDKEPHVNRQRTVDSAREASVLHRPRQPAGEGNIADLPIAARRKSAPMAVTSHLRKCAGRIEGRKARASENSCTETMAIRSQRRTAVRRERTHRRPDRFSRS